MNYYDNCRGRSWPFESSHIFDFNIRSWGMTGPYGVAAVGLSWAALTAGAAIEHQPVLHNQAPAPKVTLVGPASAPSTMLLPAQTVQFAQAAASGTAAAEPDLQPASGQSSASSRLRTPEPPRD